LTTIGSSASRLIVIRGNSGSGKTAVAAGVRAGRPRGTVAVVGQDVIRRTILGTKDGAGTTAVGLIDLAARYALVHGFDVLIEGILSAQRYGEMLRRLSDDHQGVTRCYIYDLSFEETVRRHATKVQADEFGEAEMREWWHGFQPVDGLREASITQGESLHATVDRVLEDCWLPRPQD
jgi:predicted kinase